MPSRELANEKAERIWSFSLSTLAHIDPASDQGSSGARCGQSPEVAGTGLSSSAHESFTYNAQPALICWSSSAA